MASEETIRNQLKRILAAYPQHAARLSNEQIVDMMDVWLEDLADLPDDLLVMACRNHRERSQWLPSIAEIRASAVSLMRQASPANQIASEAWADVKRAILSVGRYRQPQFSNPATAAVVRRMGWWDICNDEGPDAVLRAQFERMYNAEIERMEGKVQQSATVREFIAAMTPPANEQLPAPEAQKADAQALIMRLAEGMRMR